MGHRETNRQSDSFDYHICYLSYQRNDQHRIEVGGDDMRTTIRNTTKRIVTINRNIKTRDTEEIC